MVRILRINRIIILLTILTLLSPVVAISGKINNVQTDISANNTFLTPVGVQSGDILYYEITQFDIDFEIPNVTLPSFVGDTIFMKINYVMDNFPFFDFDGIMIFFTVGLIFEHDSTITYGSGIEAIDFTIPAGSATPGITLKGLPHFNSTEGYGPMVFCLNNDWDDHELFYEGMTFTVNNGATEFKVAYTDGVGICEGTWRKSDGVCTHMKFDNVYIPGMNFTDKTVELNLASKEYTPLPITVGDDLTLVCDIASITLSGSGPLYEELNQTAYSEIKSSLKSFEGLTIEKVVVVDMKGCWYVCDIYLINPETKILEKMTGQVIFNGFLNSIPSTDSPYYYDPYPGDTMEMISIMAPWITPDWRVYSGQLKLGDTAISVYINELLELLSATPPEEYVTIHQIVGNMELLQKKDFYFFDVAANVEIEFNNTPSIDLSALTAYEDYIDIKVELEMYIGYHESGECASLRIKADVTETNYNVTSVSAPPGSVTFNLDIKIRNPIYNPPDPLKVLPGFEWLVVIPTLLGLAAIGLIKRRK